MHVFLTQSARNLLALVLVFFCFNVLAQSITLQGQVVRVIDGDTVVLRDSSGNRHTLRLAAIDAPEKRMPYGLAARALLAHWISGQDVIALTTKQDRYGRTVATVLHHGLDINLAMVQFGMAWHYTRYAREQTPQQAATYAAAELVAHTQHRGLWQDSTPMAPWYWRRIAATMGKKQ